MIPVLTTDRLTLRAFETADFPAFAALWATEAVTRHILSEPRDETASWRSFLMNAGSWEMSGIGQWAIERDGALIGQVGFFDAKRGLGKDFDSAPECGWVIDPAHQGQGLATEAAVAAHRWFDAQQAESRTLNSVGHVASERLATRMGYRQYQVMTLDGVTCGLSRRHRPDRPASV
ncbi:MAG: GNAT family N-acetyltransferase [Paracoccaceae bacterium]